MSYLIRRVRPEDWVEVRELRLRMLLDSPTAYHETLPQPSAGRCPHTGADGE